MEEAEAVQGAETRTRPRIETQTRLEFVPGAGDRDVDLKPVRLFVDRESNRIGVASPNHNDRTVFQIPLADVVRAMRLAGFAIAGSA